MLQHDAEGRCSEDESRQPPVCLMKVPGCASNPHPKIWQFAPLSFERNSCLPHQWLEQCHGVYDLASARVGF